MLVHGEQWEFSVEGKVDCIPRRSFKYGILTVCGGNSGLRFSINTTRFSISGEPIAWISAPRLLTILSLIWWYMTLELALAALNSEHSSVLFPDTIFLPVMQFVIRHDFVHPPTIVRFLRRVFST